MTLGHRDQISHVADRKETAGSALSGAPPAPISRRALEVLKLSDAGATSRHESKMPYGLTMLDKDGEKLISDVVRRLHHAQIMSAELSAILTPAASTGYTFTKIGTPEDVRGVWATACTEARRQLWFLEASDWADGLAVDTEQESHRALDRGVSLRILDHEDVHRQLDTASLAGGGDHGKDVAHRVVPLPTYRMLIADQRCVVLCESRAEPMEAILLTAPSLMVDLTVNYYQSLWESSTPLSHESDSDEDETAILPLLAAGLGDQAIGRRLNISARTVQRRVRSLMEKLDASTRFQAGINAKAKGWI